MRPFDRLPAAWDPVQLVNIGNYRQHTGSVFSVAFNSDGTLAGSSGEDGTIRTWSLKKDFMVQTVEVTDFKITQVTFSPDGKFLATGSNGAPAKLWDIKTRQCIRSFEKSKEKVNAVIFNRDGSMLAYGSVERSNRADSVENRWKRQKASASASMIPLRPGQRQQKMAPNTKTRLFGRDEIRVRRSGLFGKDQAGMIMW